MVMGKENGRFAIYVLAGIYILYLAFQMFEGLSAADSEKTIMIIFIVFFTVAGSALLGLGIWNIWKKAKESKQRQ